MPIDINNLRPERGGNPEEVFASEKNRFRSTDSVNKTIELDSLWRKSLFHVENLRKIINSYQKRISYFKKHSINDEDAENDISIDSVQKNIVDSLETHSSSPNLPEPEELNQSQLTNLLSFMRKHIVNVEESLKSISAQRESFLKSIGNLLDPSVKISNNEDENVVLRTWNNPNPVKLMSETINGGFKKYLHHHELIHKIGGLDMKKGVEVAGHRGYYLKGYGVLLNMALLNYGLNFLIKKGYLPMQPPFFLKKDIMEESSELKDFEETLYQITNEENTKENFFMIATSEQPLCAYNRGESLEEKDLPIRYAGLSTCFRKEAGSHGKDTWGIFRVHQFEKIEQLCITSPDKSREMHEEMTNISEEFYQSLGLSYRIISIVSGALNDAASKKYDLEAWFPGYNEYKELVSCSNCTDYQSRALDIHMGYKTVTSQARPFVHMLNGTLVASERCLCCILENYQTETGIKVPNVLVPYVGTEFIKFVE